MYLLSGKKKRKGIMGRKKDLIWIHAVKLNNRFKCNYCNCEFSGGATRIKFHLAGVSGHDIASCESVPKEIREEVLGTYKKYEGASTPSSDTEVSLLSQHYTKVSLQSQLYT